MNGQFESILRFVKMDDFKDDFNLNELKETSFDDVIKMLELAIKRNDVDTVLETLVRCLFYKNFQDTNSNILDSALEHLLNMLIISANYSGDIPGQIFYTIIDSSLSDKQYLKLYEFLKNNFHLFQSERGSYLMAEWLGGCRNKEALCVIKYWFDNMKTELDRENVKTALWEFLDNDYIYEAPEELKLEARNLQLVTRKMGRAKAI
jgi:hypothetical protein